MEKKKYFCISSTKEKDIDTDLIWQCFEIYW